MDKVTVGPVPSKYECDFYWNLLYDSYIGSVENLFPAKNSIFS
jgi:hypothetical protein